jgi:AcrR family transcriptional regulator
MDDIARCAGISRSALYLHFRNKEDILRSMASAYFAETEAAVAQVLSDLSAPAADVLAAAIAAKDGKFMDVVIGTAHGHELLDAGIAITGDLALAWETRVAALMADWFRKRGGSPDLGSPEDVAQTLMAALKGLKTTSRNLDGHRAAQARLAAIFVRALNL